MHPIICRAVMLTGLIFFKQGVAVANSNLFLTLSILMLFSCSNATKGAPDVDSTPDSDTSTESTTESEANTDSNSDTHNNTDSSTQTHNDGETDTAEYVDISEPAGGPLRGAFLQVRNTHSVEDVTEAIRMMYQVNMETVIVEAESRYSSEGVDDTLDTSLLNAILDEAQYRKMRVWIGLASPMSGGGETSSINDAEYMAQLIKKSIESIDRITANVASHPAFDGYYLPFDAWTTDLSNVGTLGTYYAQISEYCRSTGDENIVASAFISDTLSSMALVQESLEILLSNSAITVYILKDSVGERGLNSSDFTDNVAPYFQAAQNACDTSNIVFWGSVDSFHSIESDPGNVFNLIWSQYELAAQYASSVVTYEFMNYWTQYVEDTLQPSHLHSQYHALLFM